VKLQHVFYVEKLALKSDRIAPTLRDVTKVRSVKGLKDLLGALSDLLEGAKGLLGAPKNLGGNPKELREVSRTWSTSRKRRCCCRTLRRRPSRSSSAHWTSSRRYVSVLSVRACVRAFGTLDLVAYKQFIRAVEDVLFVQRGLQRGKMATSYTKDEISVDLVDEYYADIDYAGHICYPVGVAAWPRSRSLAQPRCGRRATSATTRRESGCSAWRSSPATRSSRSASTTRGDEATRSWAATTSYPSRRRTGGGCLVT